VRAALGGIAVAAIAALLGSTATTAGAATSPCARSAGSGSHDISIESGGRRRHAVIHVAAGTPVGAAVPVVLVLHGAGQTGARMESYSGMSAVADRKGFMAVYPSAVTPHPFWNYYGDRHRPDDVHFIRILIDHIEATRCVDRTRVYATGVSNGGGMAARLGCKLSTRLAAIAPVAGGYAHLPSCRPAPEPLSVLEIHGTADRTVPYWGSGPDQKGSAQGFVREWAARDGCASKPKRRRPSAHVVRLDWAGCVPGIRVRHFKIEGGTHEWPGWPATGTPPRASDGVSASWEVWRFFAPLHR
jgi:polyhydroxybutyrate depolymerase